MKKVLLSVAVATIVAAPIAQAGSSLTGSLRYGLNYSDEGGDNDAQIDLTNFGSRIKMSGDTDLGGGKTGYGKLELRLADSRNGTVVNRTYAVGVKGDFGDISFGVQDTAFDIANPDRSWWNGGFGRVGLRDEKHGALRYSKNFGDVELRVGAAMQTNDQDATPPEEVEAADVFDIGVKYAANNIMLAAAMQSVAATEGTATSLSGGYNFGAGDFTVTYGIEDEDFTGGGEKTGLNAQVGVGNFYGWYGQTEVDGADATPNHIGVGYTHKMSDQMLIWTELFQSDPDTDDDATMGLNSTLKIDF